MNVFRTARVIAATPAAVFAAMEDPVRLARWWGPDGFTNTFSRFEFAPGGRWEFVMHGPDGTDYPNRAEFIEIDRDMRVCIRHDCAPLFTLTITLAADGSATRVEWQQAFDDPRVAEAVRHIVEPANEQNLDRLGAEVLAGGA